MRRRRKLDFDCTYGEHDFLRVAVGNSLVDFEVFVPEDDATHVVLNKRQVRSLVEYLREWLDQRDREGT